jgi:plasmid stabilization system protein ParE
VTLRFTAPALRDLDEILFYIAQRSPQGARRVQERLRIVLDVIGRHPRIGALTSDPVIRRMPALPYPYLIFYEAGDGEIIIHAVRHAAREPEAAPVP